METPISIPTQQGLSFSKLFYKSFTVYKAAFKSALIWQLLFIIGYIVALFIGTIIASFAVGLETLKIFLYEAQLQLHSASPHLPGIIFLTFSLILLLPLLVGLFINCGLNNTLYKRLLNQPASFSSACRFAARRMWTLLLYTIVIAIVFELLFVILSILPAIMYSKFIVFLFFIINLIVFAWLWIYVLLSMLLVSSHTGSLFKHMKQAAILLWGNWWFSFLLCVLAGIILLLAALIVMLLGSINSVMSAIAGIIFLLFLITIFIPWFNTLLLAHLQNLSVKKNLAID